MPELPEVETIVRQLKAEGVEGGTIRSVQVTWEKTVEPWGQDDFANELMGATVSQLSRYGKWIIFSLNSKKVLMVHLRMSGHFATTSSAYDRVIVEFGHGLILYFSDPRKFARWKLVDSADEILGALGPDALTDSFSIEYMESVCRARCRAVKPLLLDQAFVAGIGNIYADEALWESEIHPLRVANSLRPDEIKRLYDAIIKVLRIGVKNRGTSLGKGTSNYRDLKGESGGHREEVKAYGRAGLRCERCDSVLQKIIVAQRGTSFCPSCQLNES